VINSPVIITGAGTDSNQTAYKLEFYSVDPISPDNASSYANGYIAGQLAFIANTLDCSFDSARTLARMYGSENGSWDLYNGFGKIKMEKIITDPLPVELISFSSVVRGKRIILKWETQTEINNYGFEIQRSDDRNEWNILGFVEGNGNSNSPKSYSYFDEGIKLTGKYYYRLRQIDNDGSSNYSEILEVNIGLPDELELKQNYPNPFNPTTTISFSIPQTGEVVLTVYNALGELVKTVAKGFLEQGEYSFSFNAEGLTSGIYIYRLRISETILTRKMLLLK
ncbi:MAG: T9SS type A sorting domain-containing protein, partial [Ignavibacteriaceae bacterium]